MQDRRASFGQGLAAIMRDVLPILNLMVLLLPIVLLGIEFVGHSAIAVTLPDPSPDVASLDTPPAPRPSVSGSRDRAAARSNQGPQTEDAQVVHEPTPTATSVFSGSPLGYGD